jgi:hypothetical protein
MFKLYLLGCKTPFFEPGCCYFSHNSAAIPLKMSIAWAAPPEPKTDDFRHQKQNLNKL